MNHIERPDEHFPKVGSLCTFGCYYDEAIEWRVLEVREGAALLITEKALECKKYDKKTPQRTTWLQCSLRSWLNGKFLQKAFSPSERERIRATVVPGGESGGYRLNDPDAHDLVFCLSIDEAKRYFEDDIDRVCYPTNRAKLNGAWTSSDTGGCVWWLRPQYRDDFRAPVVTSHGEVYWLGYHVGTSNWTVRPALWIIL